MRPWLRQGASASEELTAQSRQMKAMVNELVALVGDRGPGLRRPQETMALSDLRSPGPTNHNHRKMLSSSPAREISAPHLLGTEGEFKEF